MRYYEIMEDQSIQPPRYVYHATERENEKSILQNGLRTGSLDLGHKETSYKDRIYFFSEFSKNGILDYMGEVFSKRHKRNIHKDSTSTPFYLVPYSVIKVDTSGLPNEWFVDPWSQTYCKALYTTSPIPSSSIVGVVDREDTDHSSEFKKPHIDNDDFPQLTNQTPDEIRAMPDGFEKYFLAMQYMEKTGINLLDKNS